MNDHVLKDNISALDFVNFQIAELIDIKQKLELKVIEGLQHNHEGSKTYDVGKYKVTVKTDFIYSLDKDEYHIYKSKIPPAFNPIKEDISYRIDKRIIKHAEEYASSEEMLLLGQLIVKKPSKPNVKVSANV